MKHSVQSTDLSLAVRSEAALALVHLSRGDRVADLGCATGAFAARLARLGTTVTAIDISGENLAELRRLHADLVSDGRLIPIRGSLTRLPLEAGTVDIAFCLEVLEHIEEDRVAIDEIARVLKPEGRLVLSVPNRVAPKPLAERLGLTSVHDEIGPEQHVRDGYTAIELQEQLSAAGLEPEQIIGVGGAMFRVVTGAVSIAHLGYRRLRGQPSWTWADVERDSRTMPLRIYRAVFPALHALVRLERPPTLQRASTILVTAKRES